MISLTAPVLSRARSAVSPVPVYACLETVVLRFGCVTRDRSPRHDPSSRVPVFVLRESSLAVEIVIANPPIGAKYPL